MRHASLLSEPMSPLSNVLCVASPLLCHVPVAQQQQPLTAVWNLCDSLFFFSLSFHSFSTCFPLSHRLWRLSLCLLRCLSPQPPPFLSVVAHFVFSCCFTLCFGLFLSIRLINWLFTSVFMVVRVIAADSPSNHLQNQLWPSNLAQLLCYYCIKYISKYKHICIVDKGRNKIGIGN